VATHAEQQRNKAPRAGGTSTYKGVYACKNGWRGKFSYTTSDGKIRRYHATRRQTEKEIVLMLNAKRLEIHGDKAVLDRSFM
jgi:hypothetical protein